MSNRHKDALLGEPHGTASARLRKALLFKYATKAGDAICYRCWNPIERVEEFSIEHTESWQTAADPRAVFFDLSKIAFSHLSCNVDWSDRSKLISRNTGKPVCDRGHVFDAANTLQGQSGWRRCRQCNRERMREVRSVDRNYGR